MITYQKGSSPLIGCGLAGGDWKKVEVILNKLSSEFPEISIVVYEL